MELASATDAPNGPGRIDYSRVFTQAIDRLHAEGRYRVFIDILRNKGAFPNARCFAGHNGPKPVTVWCSNDYLAMGQHPKVIAAMEDALHDVGAGSGGIGAFVGHLYPVWLKFRGGKGVATLLGIVAALHWPCGLVYAAVWLALLAIVRISSVAGMAAAVAAPLAMAGFGKFDYVLSLMAMALLVMWKHRENIERLLAGTEPKVGGRSTEGVEQPSG